MTALQHFFLLPSLQDHESSLQNYTYRTNFGRYLSITHSPYPFDFCRQKNTNYITWTVHCKNLLDEWSLKFPPTSYCNKKPPINQFLLLYNGLWPKAVTCEKPLQLDRTGNTRNRLSISKRLMSIVQPRWELFITKNAHQKMRSAFYWQLLGRCTHFEL